MSDIDSALGRGARAKKNVSSGGASRGRLLSLFSGLIN